VDYLPREQNVKDFASVSFRIQNTLHGVHEKCFAQFGDMNCAGKLSAFVWPALL
jgi:hypothetical protein